MTIGEIYYFLVDGCAGSACDVTISVLGNCGGTEIEDLEPIDGPTEVCVGETVTYTGVRPDGANTLHWYVDGVEEQAGPASSNEEFQVSWSATGVHEICLDASQDPCIPVTEDPDPVCLTVNVVEGTPVSITGDTEFCEGGSSVLDAGPGFNSYHWSTGATTQTITVTAAGTYSVTVNEAGGCISSDAIVITVWDAPDVSASSNSPVCIGGTIQLNANGGSNYSWSGPGGFTSNLQNPSIPNATSSNGGSYIVVVTDGSGCSASDTVMVQVNVLPIGSAGSNSPLCSGQTLNLSASGGVTYEWSGPNGFSSTMQNPSIPNAMTVNSGTYSVTVTNAEGCYHVPTVNVVVHALPVANASSNSPVCVGGTIQLNASGGNTYNWTGLGGFSSSQQNPSISNAAPVNAGTYFVSVTDGNGCLHWDTTDVTISVAPIASASSNSPICTGQTLFLNASGGVSYQWSGPAGFSSNQQNPSIVNATIANTGTYSVTVTNAEGCIHSATTFAVVHAEPVVTATSNSPVCLGGTIQLYASGGLVYSWTGPGGFSSNLQNPTIPNADFTNEGTYTVVVADGNGCTSSASAQVQVFEVPFASAGSNSPICSGQNLLLTASGGVAYLWSGPNGFSSNQQNPVIPNASSIHGGTYSVTVTNAEGCLHAVTTTVLVYSNPNATASSNAPFCAGNDLLLYASGGVSYLWSGPGGFSSSAQNPFIQNAGPLQSGSYSVTVTGSQGCTSTAVTNVTIWENPEPMIMGSTSFCAGGYTILSAGSGYSGYLWSTGSTAEEIYVDQADIYSVMVTDQNGCIGADTVEVIVGLNLLPTITGDTVFCDSTSGLLHAGSGFITYLWSTGQTTSSISIQTAGVYSVTVTDGTGCSGTDQVTVVAGSTPKVVASSNGPLCSGQTIQLMASGGVIYQWSGPLGFQSNQQSPVIPNASPGMSGSYRVIVTNSGGCADTAWVDVQVGGGGNGILADALVPQCPGDTLFLFANGGKFYNWVGPDSFQSTLKDPFIPFAGPENSGSYIVSDTSVQGCISRDTIHVSIPVGPAPEIKGNLFICLGKEAVLDAGPGFRGYYWSNGKRGRIMRTKEPGLYWVLVTDGSCCVGVDSAIVVITDKLEPQIKGDTVICLGDTSVLDAGPGYSGYLWSTGDTTQVIAAIQAGEYHVTVTNSSGCIGTDTVLLEVNQIPDLTVEVDPLVCADSCEGRLELLPDLQGHSYTWSTGDSTRILEGLCAGMYQVTVTVSGGCSKTLEMSLSQPPPLSVMIEKVDSILNALVSGGVPPYTYLWNNGKTTASSPALPPGFHSVTVTDANGCKAVAIRLITPFTEVVDPGMGIILHPNPAGGTLMLSPAKGPIFEVPLLLEVYNVLGVKLMEGSIEPGAERVTLDTSAWASGTYFMKVRSRHGEGVTLPFRVLH